MWSALELRSRHLLPWRRAELVASEGESPNVALLHEHPQKGGAHTASQFHGTDHLAPVNSTRTLSAKQQNYCCNANLVDYSKTLAKSSGRAVVIC